jgi:hypothetical protein
LETNTFLSYQKYTGKWKQILFFRTRTTLEIGKKNYFLSYQNYTGNWGEKHFSFAQELHCNLETLLSYKDNTVNHKQRTSLYYKDNAHCNLKTTLLSYKDQQRTSL